jgi:hypothetical protein
MALFKNKLNGEDKAKRKKSRQDTEEQVSRMERDMDYIEAQVALIELITNGKKASNARMD